MNKDYGVIINGRLIPGKAPGPKQNSQWKAADQDRQRTEHAADLVQPYNPDGTINKEFSWVYPEESRIYKGEK